MKKLAFLFFAAALFVGAAQVAQAITVSLPSKQITVQFVISPSPSPIVYVPAAPAAAPAYGLPSFDAMLAYSPVSTSDMMNATVLAMATPQSSVKVQFVVKPDPNYQYFHIIPGATTTFNAGYGSNTFTCAYQIFGHYTTNWSIGDYIYGSNTSGGTAGLNGFPQYNYPTTSDLSWLAETKTTSFLAFSNGGAPGQTTFTGAAGTTYTICIDLGLTVPSNIPAGTYSTTINYYLQHS